MQPVFFFVRIKGDAWNIGHSVCKRDIENIGRVYFFRSRYPEEESAFRVSPFYLFREVLLKSRKHGVSALFIQSANKLGMLFHPFCV